MARGYPVGWRSRGSESFPDHIRERARALPEFRTRSASIILSYHYLLFGDDTVDDCKRSQIGTFLVGERHNQVVSVRIAREGDVGARRKRRRMGVRVIDAD